MTNKVFDEGYDAGYFASGTNPYVPDTQDWRTWNDGAEAGCGDLMWQDSIKVGRDDGN